MCLILLPECDLLHYEGVVVDASGWKTHPQHILSSGDVVMGGDALQVHHEATNGWLL